MARTLATAYVALQPSFRGVENEIRRGIGEPLKQEAEKSGREAGGRFGDAFNAESRKSMQDFGKKAVVGAGILTVAIGKSAEAAGNLEAALAANEQVMGSSSSEVQAWAKNSVEAVGMSERAALEAATTFGVFGMQMGLTGTDLADFSIDVTTLAADMAAFKDVAPEQALQDLTSAFAGSTETMQKYGIFLQDAALKQAIFEQTGEKVTGVLTPQQKLLATHAVLMEDSAHMQGQWNREIDQLAAKQAMAKAEIENAAAAIGATFMPVAASAFGLVADGASKFAELDSATGGAIGKITMVGTGLLGAGGAMSFVVGKAGDLVSGFRGMSTSMQKASLAAGGLATAAAIGYAVWSTYQERQAIARQRIQDAAEALSNQTREAWANADAMTAAGEAVDGATVANEAFGNALVDGATHSDRFIDALGELNLSGDQAYETMLRIGADPVEGLRQLAIEAGHSAEEADALATAVNEIDSAEGLFDQVSGEFGQAATQLGLTREQAELWNDEMAVTAHALEELQDQTEDYDGQLADIARGYINAAIESKQLTPELVAQAEAQAGATTKSEDAVEVYFALQEILASMTTEERNAALGIEEFGSAATDAEASAEDLSGTIGDVTDEASGLNTVAASSITVTDRLGDEFAALDGAASALSTALDRLIGRNLDLQAAEDALEASTDELKLAIDEAKASGDENALSLSAQTEAGRANREMIRSNVEASFDYAEAMLENGATAGEATAAIEANRLELLEQLNQFGLTEAEARDYLDTLGLTPDNIETSVELMGDEQARTRIEDLISDLGDIPETEMTRIQALIDNEHFAEAERRLLELSRDRQSRVIVTTVVGSGSRVPGGVITESAWGNYFDRPSVTSIAEDGDAEAVLTLQKPSNLRAQLNDPRIRIPIEQALGDGASSTLGGLSVQFTGPVTMTEPTDADKFAQLITTRLAAVS